ncbi:MAG: hypothetical protein JZU62_01840 [Sulfuricurvum sp.]|uniref:hypothetical protein n=1 Tax=Sulfuricurvum sp. TaxID=2025608 RepID=UPI0025E2CE38|nr:hypothetical protein [Sulfuricurvum sp.]MBV5320401.1 hypothetical protein [Sulfuricurvum sp.]
MRIVLLLLIGYFSLFSHESFIINTHIRMLPKIMALDSRLSSKIDLSKVVFAVVYDSNHKSNANTIADEINKVHNGKVSNIPFTAIALSVNEVTERRDISFVYITQKCNTKSLKKIASWGIENSIPTFSYDVSDLDYGILGSVAIERNAIIYINKNTLKEGKFHFDGTLYQIARLIE